MEEAATTVPRCTRPLRRITPVAGLTTLMAVTTRHRAGITHLRHVITSQHRGITTNRGFINRHRVITSPRHGVITGLIRIAAGTVIAVAVGTDVTVAVGAMTIAVAMVDAITVADEATTTVAAITMAGAATVKRSLKSGALIAAFFVPGFQYSDRPASGCRPSQTLLKCASTTASGTLLMSGQCQCGFWSLSINRARTPSLNSG